NQFSRREMVHAYLLTGARGLGKRTFAKVLASALFCTSAEKPCGHCAECEHFFGEHNPDVLNLYADDGKQIGVERVRETIRGISQHAFGSSYRVVLIEPVEKLTPAAQSCLLKSLEEPVANVVFLLMTHELTATLGTIASRCVRVKMIPWSDELLAQTLRRLGHPEEKIALVLPRCGGNIGMALELLEENAQETEVQAFVREALAMVGDAQAVSVSTHLKEGRADADQYLTALEQAIHLVLLVRTGGLDRSLLREYPPIWQRAAQEAPVADLSAMLGAVFEARKRKASQVNWQSNIDHLLMKLLEEQTKWHQLLA
ncbi:MAG: AAA family ATPase, partial [Clostridia bacterium]